MYQKYIKNILDFLLSLILLIILSPLFLIIAIISHIDDPEGSVFFYQQRAGQFSKPFSCIKFRSMKVTAPKNASTWELKNADSHITRFGKILRKTSLDELPQLINIVRGEMSFVGPRPVILKEHELINLRKENGSDKVKPGVTGLSQIRGRDNLSPFDKAYTDGIYASDVSFIGDMKIFFMTIPKVLHREGITEGEQDFDNEKEMN